MSLLKIAVNVLKGDEPAVDLWNKIKELVGQASGVAETSLETFVTQFATPFGQQVLALGAVEAPAVLSGEQTIQQAKNNVTAQVTADAVTDAEKAGQVTLDAIRVSVSALNAQKTGSATTIAPQPPLNASAS